MRLANNERNGQVLILEPDAEFFVAREAVSYIGKLIILDALVELDSWFADEVDVVQYARRGLGRNSLFSSDTEVHAIPLEGTGDLVTQCVRLASDSHPDELIKYYCQAMWNDFNTHNAENK